MSTPLKVQGLYAAMLVSNLKAAEAFYTKVLGRAPDDRPMPTLIQWRGFGMAAGIQLFEGSGTPGGSRMTLVVPDMVKARDELASRGLTLGEISQGTYGKIAQLADEDGNTITFAEPPSSQ
jgi:catechol 2,3-dioxygenase-like lactoylglutathione lyase family enzyme